MDPLFASPNIAQFEAKLRIPNAGIEDTEPRKALTRKPLRGLAACAGIDAHHNTEITIPTGADATCDRILHNARLYMLQSDSRRRQTKPV
ncbi:MAG: hypothetical protein GY725_25970 [bacterium]|nr:hypothetical protein [bacterium]